MTLLDRSDRFVFKPLLYELLTGQLNESQARGALSRSYALHHTPCACGTQVAPTFADLLADTGVRCVAGARHAAQRSELTTRSS